MICFLEVFVASEGPLHATGAGRRERLWNAIEGRGTCNVMFPGLEEPGYQVAYPFRPPARDKSLWVTSL